MELTYNKGAIITPERKKRNWMGMLMGRIGHLREDVSEDLSH